QGLGGLPAIDPGTGMLFDLGWEQTINVTTVPMLFPLDICFLSEGLVVVDIYQDVPPGYLVTSSLPARYFLEVNAGELEGVDTGDRASVEMLPFEEVPVAMPDWTSMMVSFLGFVVMASFMVAVVRSFIEGMLEAPGEKPALGRGGERLLPQTKSRRRPTRADVRVEVWDERDRLHIGIQDKRTDDYIASWWDDEAWQMFEDGFFKRRLPGRLSERDRVLVESVLAYAEEVGILATPWQQRSISREATPKPVKPVFFIGGCQVSCGACSTHGYSVSETSRCPESPLTDDEWTAIWRLLEEPPLDMLPQTAPLSLQEAEDRVQRYAASLWRAHRNYADQLRRMDENYRLAIGKAVENYRAYVMAEYERSRGAVGVSARLIGPTEERHTNLEYLADSPEFLAQTIDDTGYRDRLADAFQQAIARARDLRKMSKGLGGIS
ncbi:MAG: DUF192 domain-containing protein, partial [Chloroflexota bacterium]|nr:DUF192 domain-containing protein [Chloroflexota bacterium]